MSEKFEKIPSTNSRELIPELINRYFDLSNKYPEKRILEVVKFVSENQSIVKYNPPKNLIDDLNNISMLQRSPGIILSQLLARCRDYVGDEIADKAIEFGVRTWDTFPFELTKFLACQLCFLDKATRTKKEALAYLAQRIQFYAPKLNYNIKFCDCPDCYDYPYPKLIVSTENLANITCQSFSFSVIPAELSNIIEQNLKDAQEIFSQQREDVQTSQKKSEKPTQNVFSWGSGKGKTKTND